MGRQRQSWPSAADVPSWIGIGLSLIGAGWAWKSWKATASAGRAEERAEQVLVASQSIADSSSRMADSPGNIALSYAQVRDLPEAAQVTREPAWNVEYRTGDAYVLRNVGIATASQVTADAGGSMAKTCPPVTA